MYTYKPDRCKVPISVWALEGSIESSALEQIENAASLPFAEGAALMPDGHLGKGAPIGGVLATSGVVVVNFIGSDIGCGMCAVKTTLKAEQLDKETLKKIMGKIREIIPVGFEHQKEKQDEILMPKMEIGVEVIVGKEGEKQWVRNGKEMRFPFICRTEYQSALKQLGTLGGGNHFIEIQKDTEGYIWIMIHSGSRNLGKKVADHYNKLAIEMNKKWYSLVLKEWELAFLPIETQEAKDYMNEMKYCVDFALANRSLMMSRIVGIFSMETSCLFEPTINIAHNYARFENHFGQNVIVHRKGATSAREGEIGIIPGSMGSHSYIVKGKGNPKSFESCSHGAGRKMGRNVAKKTLNLAEEIKKLDDQGIVHGVRNQQDLDEATGSYKSIEDVMHQQEDLVEILVELSPLGSIKG